jgi:hypothetical protein
LGQVLFYWASSSLRNLVTTTQGLTSDRYLVACSPVDL